MIEIISGTNRRDSNTRKVVSEVSEVLSGAGVDHGILDLQELPEGMFHPDIYASKPEAFAPFADRVVAADGLLVVTPEYNGGFPGILKFFIDLLKFPESFDRKPVAFVGLAAGQWGGMRAVEQLQSVFSYRNAHIYPVKVFMPGIGGLLDGEGKIKEAALRDRLAAQAVGFAEFAGKFSGT